MSEDTAIKLDDDIFDTDDIGSLENGVEVLDEELFEEYETISNEVSFISDSGDIVVMDDSENGDNFKLAYIDIENIAVVNRIRKNNNVDDLVKSIKSTGLLMPVVVAPTATQGLYVLINGYRRLLACARSGKRNIPCIINTKVNTPEIPVLEAIYNHSKRYSNREIVDYIEYLEKQTGLYNASMIEYLLQLNSGDYTKLKDILNDDDDEIVSKLFDGSYSIEAAFRKLEQRRKKETIDEKELKKAEKVYENEEESGADSLVGTGEEADGVALTEDEIKRLAISVHEIDNGLDDESLEDMIEEGKNIDGYKPYKQDPNHREYLDPAVRKAVLARDKNTCQICKYISGQEYVETLDVHHILEVYLGGDDDVDNLIVCCTVCHKLIHLYGRGDLYIRPLEEMSEHEQIKFKKIVKLGNYIRQGVALKGIKKQELKKLDRAETIGRRLKGSSDQVAG